MTEPSYHHIPGWFSWIEPERLGACGYPGADGALARLAGLGVRRLINLHTTPLPADALARHGLTELHVPVVDFTAPTAEQLRHGVDAIEAGLAAGEPVAVNCGAGLGRTGTLIACYLVSQGLSPDEAIARVRAARPGSVETAEQAAAVAAFARG